MSDFPLWFRQWLANQPPDRKGLGSTFKRLLKRITIPDGAITGDIRYVIGADTPPELVAFGINVAIIGYITNVLTGIEVGYFFIGLSNQFDGGAIGRVQAFGNVTYPTPGDPTSPTQNDVKTNFQQNMWAQFPNTIFKDHKVLFRCSVKFDIDSGGGDQTFELVGPSGDVRYLTAQSRFVNGISNNNFNIAVNAYADLPGGSASVTINKDYDAGFSKLRTRLEMSFFVTNVGSHADFAIQANGVDTLAITSAPNNALTRLCGSGTVEHTGLAAGSYTVKARWKNRTAVGTVNRDVNDYIAITCEEVSV